MIQFKECRVEHVKDKDGVTIKFTLLKEISNLVIDAHFYTERMGHLKHLISIRELDVCEVLSDSKKHKTPIINIFKEMVLSSGGTFFQKCPLPTDVLYELIRMNMDAKSFPFLPETNFLLAYSFRVNNIKRAIAVNVSGEIVSRRRKRIG